jgi:hypothetical protein
MESAMPIGRAYTGEFRPLHKYLRDRFADRVVLTFGEIEDLLGFPLPAPAHLQAEWWDGAGSVGGPLAHAEAWLAAGRTAVVNMSSKRVVFDREASHRH